ncbi:hypothetical protein LIER_14177 [Lithospermum erythrorhizon]|uniref:Uncharacterized protein n=1 Tax=Lithospermum erythrorhizon TaxID=34254 RepID=A0AAV3Q0H2_LITER
MPLKKNSRSRPNVKEPVHGFWREEGEPYLFHELHCIDKDLFTLKALNKDPRKFVHESFLKTTFLEVYIHTLEPFNGPTMWTKSPYHDILPSDIRMLLGRPKRCRRVDPSEQRDKAEKADAEKAKKVKPEGVFKASRHGTVIHSKICGTPSHNARNCPRRPGLTSSSQPAPATVPGASTQPLPQTQPPTTRSRKKK